MPPNRFLLILLALAVGATAEVRAHRGQDPRAELASQLRPALVQAQARAAAQPSHGRNAAGTAFPLRPLTFPSGQG